LSALERKARAIEFMRLGFPFFIARCRRSAVTIIHAPHSRHTGREIRLLRDDSKMQTFLPYSSFIESVRCLDRQRLGKQRVEALQILNALNGKSKGWTNHPATKMWCGYEEALCLYKDLCI